MRYTQPLYLQKVLREAWNRDWDDTGEYEQSFDLSPPDPDYLEQVGAAYEKLHQQYAQAGAEDPGKLVEELFGDQGDPDLMDALQKYLIIRRARELREQPGGIPKLRFPWWDDQS